MRRRKLYPQKTTLGSQHGFTIVELLIVIVVIGILAAITIVAYNGISSKARIASLQSDLENSNKQLIAYLGTSSTGYPTALDCSASPAANTICLKSSNNTTYQYSVNNSLNPPTYCLTATNATTSYFFGTTQSAPTSGGCPGHGVGGVAPITNFIYSPIGPTQTPGSGPAIQPNNYYINTAAADSNEHAVQLNAGVFTTGTVAESAWVKSSVAGTIYLKARTWDGTSNTYYTIGSSTVSANQWTYLSATHSITVPAGTLSAAVYMSNYLSSDVMYIATPMLTQGTSVYNYTDPTLNSSWVWNGTANNSTSTGPPQ